MTPLVTPLELLDGLREAGLKVQLKDGALLVGPKRLLTPERRELVHRYTEELKGLLATGWPADTQRMFEAMIGKGK